MSKSRGRQRLAVLRGAVDQHADQVRAVAALALPDAARGRTRRPPARSGDRNGRCLYCSLSGLSSQVLRCSPGRCCRPSRCPSRSAARCRSSGTSSSRASTWIGKSALTFSTKSNSAFREGRVHRRLGQPAQEVLVVAHQVALHELALDELAQRPVPRCRRSPASTGGASIRSSSTSSRFDELRRRERLRVPVDGADVGVARHRPEARFGVRFGVPVHRVPRGAACRTAPSPRCGRTGRCRTGRPRRAAPASGVTATRLVRVLQVAYRW